MNYNYKPHLISWNLTQRCNLRCAHCYIDASYAAAASGELSREQCLQIVDDMAAVNSNALLILTGGEPLIRKDLFDIAKHASLKGFSVVIATNGLMLNEETIQRMRHAKIVGASISIDSTDPEKHDRFRQYPGSWKAAVRAAKLLAASGFYFSIHTSITSWNLNDIPKLINMAKELGAKAVNFFFLICTGRGEQLTDITPQQYESILTYLAEVEGVSNGQIESNLPLKQEGLWTTPMGQKGGMLIRARCAPFFQRVIYQLNPGSPLLQSFAYRGCPAGKYYCRITPEGKLTPCPYMPLSAGNLLERPFKEIWERSELFSNLRTPLLKGRCRICEFSNICGGCRGRAYATYNDYLAEDSACNYQPGSYGGEEILLSSSEERAFGLKTESTISWSAEAQARLQNLPSFVRSMVAKGVERYAKEHGIAVITPDVMKAAREQAGRTSGRT